MQALMDDRLTADEPDTCSAKRDSAGQCPCTELSSIRLDVGQRTRPRGPTSRMRPSALVPMLLTTHPSARLPMPSKVMGQMVLRHRASRAGTLEGPPQR